MIADVGTAILAVFTLVGDWFIGFVPDLYVLFWNPESGLTFLGVLSVMALAIGVTLLVVNFVKDFLRFR